jgi:rubrerythrin
MATDADTLATLKEALDDEYRARSTYAKVIEKFGPVRPFINIVEAEARHIEALLRQFERLGEPAPADTWAEKVDAPSSIAEACAAGVKAEVENGAMYDRLLGKISDPAVRQVMLRLQEASQQNHLPAFKRCLARQG